VGGFIEMFDKPFITITNSQTHWDSLDVALVPNTCPQVAWRLDATAVQVAHSSTIIRINDRHNSEVIMLSLFIPAPP